MYQGKDGADVFVSNLTRITREKDIKRARAVPIPSIIAVYLRFKAFSAGANIPTLKGFERGYGSFIANLEALENGCSRRWIPAAHNRRAQYNANRYFYLNLRPLEPHSSTLPVFSTIFH